MQTEHEKGSSNVFSRKLLWAVQATKQKKKEKTLKSISCWWITLSINIAYDDTVTRTARELTGFTSVSSKSEQ